MSSANREARRGQRTFSITTRLTALFAGAALLILLTAAALLHWNLARALRSEDARLLRENVATLQSLAASSDPLNRLRDEIVSEPAATRIEPYYVRYREGSRLVLETAGMRAILPSGIFPPPGQLEEDSPMRWRSPTGRTFLLLSTPASDASGRSFQAALDVTHDERLLRGYRRVLLAVVLIGSMLAALAGYLTARQGLRPLGRLTRAVRQVTARRLDQRIGDTEWPRELDDLAAVFDGMLARLEDSFDRLSRFSADLAHELRTPLTNLRGEAEIALGQRRSAEEYQRVLTSSLEEYTRLTGLVDRLLFLARAEAGAAALEPQPLDGATEVARVCDFYAALAEERGIRLEHSGTAPLVADPLLFRRALANLLSNAVEHTPAGGRVVVTITPFAEGARVSVADTGAGIAPEHLPHVTERFYQVDPARAWRAGGAGLGLALVRSIAELHGGSIQLESEPGRGTRVSLLFPGGPTPNKMTTP